jgi:hypothetical protein
VHKVSFYHSTYKQNAETDAEFDSTAKLVVLLPLERNLVVSTRAIATTTRLQVAERPGNDRTLCLSGATDRASVFVVMLCSAGSFLLSCIMEFYKPKMGSKILRTGFISGDE